jgi:hypothetical protein
MPILETANAVLPKNNQNAPGKTIHREVAYSGFTNDGRVLTTEDVETIFKNTKAYMLDKGSLVKVKIAHDQEKTDEELKGFVTSLELHEKSKEDGGGLGLWASMHLYDDTYEKWEQGKYPEISIGPMNKVMDKKGNEYELVLDHIALLGASRAALTEFKNGTLASIIQKFNGIVEKIYSILPGKGKNNTGEYEKMEITPDEIKEMIMALDEISSKLKGLIEPMDESEEEMKADDKPEEKEDEKEMAADVKDEKELSSEKPKEENEFKANAKISKYEMQLKNELAELEYDKMFAAGKIVPDQKDNFIKIYKTQGKDFARQVYGERNIKTPPADKQFKSEQNAGEGLEEQRKRLARLGLEHSQVGKRLLDKHSNN